MRNTQTTTATKADLLIYMTNAGQLYSACTRAR